MEKCMWEIGETIKSMGLVDSHILMRGFIEASLRITKDMGRVSSHGQTRIHMKGIGRMGNSMEKESLQRKANERRGLGFWENER
jgi:hypothetical protein